MTRLSEQTAALLKNSPTWVLATTDGVTPNAVPIAFKDLKDDGRLVLFDVFMEKSRMNIEKTGQAAVTVYDNATFQGYQIKGPATYTADAGIVAEGNAVSQRWGLTVKGAVLMTIKEIINISVGSDNGKRL